MKVYISTFIFTRQMKENLVYLSKPMTWGQDKQERDYLKDREEEKDSRIYPRSSNKRLLQLILLQFSQYA